jgi:rubrerythrin
MESGFTCAGLDAIHFRSRPWQAGDVRCPVCENIEIGKALDACLICGTKDEKFIKT